MKTIFFIALPADFIEPKDHYSCGHEKSNLLKEFEYPSPDMNSSSIARNVARNLAKKFCESYCGKTKKCKECISNCDGPCRWEAYGECRDPRKFVTKINTVVSQKPGKLCLRT